MNKFIRHIRLLVLLLTLPLLWGCAQEDTPDIPVGPEAGIPETLTLRLTLNLGAGQSMRTRAALPWTENAYREECYIDPSDLCIYIYNKGGKLLTMGQPDNLTVASTDGDQYVVTAALPGSLGDEIKAGRTADFDVVVLANMRQGATAPYDYGTVETGADGLPKYDEAGDLVCSTTDTHLFTLPGDFYPDGAKKAIPMYGRQAYSLSRIDVSDIGEVAPPVEKPITMLRSLSKIEVFNTTKGTVGSDGKTYPYIHDVRMIRYNTNGLVEPNSAELTSYVDGIARDNIPAEAGYSDNYDYSDTPVTFRHFTYVTKTDGSHYHRLYAPETATDKAGFVVRMQLEQGGPLTDYYVNYPRDGKNSIPLNAAPHEEGGIGTVMLRNHIYRFNVEHVGGGQMDLKVTVKEWEKEVTEMDYTETLEVSSWLTFTETENIKVEAADPPAAAGNADEKQLSFYNETLEYAVGKFTINSPIGATWRAYLIPGENGVGAFEFVSIDSSGAVVPGSEAIYASGPVGQEGAIYIRPTRPADAYDHWAELVITVNMPDGTALRVPLTESGLEKLLIFRQKAMM